MTGETTALYVFGNCLNYSGLHLWELAKLQWFTSLVTGELQYFTSLGTGLTTVVYVSGDWLNYCGLHLWGLVKLHRFTSLDTGETTVTVLYVFGD